MFTIAWIANDECLPTTSAASSMQSTVNCSNQSNHKEVFGISPDRFHPATATKPQQSLTDLLGIIDFSLVTGGFQRIASWFLGLCD